MLCFQCGQAAECRAISGNLGICGKEADTAKLQDRVLGCLIGLARAAEGNRDIVTDSTAAVIVEGLAAALNDEIVDHGALQRIIARADAEKRKLVPECYRCMCSCGRNDDYDMRKLWTADEDIRSMKSLILLGIRDLTACAHHAAEMGRKADSIHDFLYKALFAIGMDDWGMEELTPIVLEMNEVNRKCQIMTVQTRDSLV